MEWPGVEMCPKSSRIANNSETMRQIENLRSHYLLQLLILSTGAHFQRVSEHYMVTRTFLSILTLERSSRCPVQYYTVRHPQLFCGKLVQSMHTVANIYTSSLLRLYYPRAWDSWPPQGPPGPPRAPPLPPKWQETNTSTFLAQTKPRPPP